MRALTFHGVDDVRVSEVPDPELLDPRDVIVRIELSAICGSDLHAVQGRELGLDVGTVLGHEPLGVVVEVGAEVAGFAPGDRVVAPFTTSCGGCYFCLQGLTARCEHGDLFGWVAQGCGLHGAQAEYLRVPLADSTLVAVPSGTSDEAALLAGDVLSTGFFCAELGGVSAGASVAVVGAGPVGLMAVVAAQELGAARVYALDAVPERLALAQQFGAVPLQHAARQSIEQIRDETGGRGADAALECVGSPAATRLAVDAVRVGGTLAAVGVHNEPHLAFSPGEAYDKNLTYRAGRCPARAMMERTLPLAASGRYDLAAIVSHRLPLAEGPRAYELFGQRVDGCTKVLLEV